LAVIVNCESVLASPGVTDNQLPPPVTLVVKDTGEEADRLSFWVRGVVDPTIADGIQDAGLGVMVGGAAPVAVIRPPVRLN
jgi:hypothetical protein